MGRKKKKASKPWCWYCNREFDDEKILIQHQKAKHFKCHICHKKLYTGPGLSIHCMQVHKEAIDKVPNSLPNRSNIEIEIYGMEGIPPEDVREHEKQKTGGGSKASDSDDDEPSAKKKPSPALLGAGPSGVTGGILPTPLAGMAPGGGMPPGMFPHMPLNHMMGPMAPPFMQHQHRMMMAGMRPLFPAASVAAVAPSKPTFPAYRSKDNTPVQGILEATNDSMDMFSDNIESDDLSETTHDQGNLELQAEDVVTINSISSLLDRKLKVLTDSFDQKLETVMFQMIYGFRANMNEDVKNEIRSEVNVLFEEFRTATNGIYYQQEEFKHELATKDDMIRGLECENAQIRSELDKLNSRLAAIEKASPSNNLELQAVPELSGENVLAFFKKLCKTIDISISDSDVHACRRIANMDSSSKRPRNILVTLSGPHLRDSILSAVTRYEKGHAKEPLSTTHLGIKGEATKIFVVEHLSPEQKYLHATTRAIALEKQYKYLWVILAVFLCVTMIYQILF